MLNVIPFPITLNNCKALTLAILTLINFSNSTYGANPQRPPQAIGQISTQQYRIGISTWTGYKENVEGFKAGLKDNGITLDKITFFEHQTGADKERVKLVAKTFNEQNLDLVYSLTTSGTSIMKEHLSNKTPIVFSIVTYPADSGLIESFEYSGNNLVGSSNFVPYHHYLDLLKLFLPNAKSLAVFSRSGEPNSKIQAIEIRRLFRKHNISVQHFSLENIDAIKKTALSLVGKVDVFMSTTDTLMQSGGEDALIAISLAHGIPILSSNKMGIEAGATFGPVADFRVLGEHSGRLAAKILLEQARPTELTSKLQSPPTFLVNLKSLQSVGLKLPTNISAIKNIRVVSD